MIRVESAHSRYRRELEALASPDVLPAAANEAGERWGWPEQRDWRRMHERFEPDREPYATCVLATAEPPQRIVRLEVFGCGIRATRFPEDSALSTLPRVLTGRSSVVRYHPGRRCTIRLDENGDARFVKVYADESGVGVHADGLELSRAADRGELDFLVAAPERFDPELRAVWQERVGGDAVKHRLDEPLAQRIGHAAASLPRSSVRPRRRRDRQGELDRSTFRCAELVRRVPELREPARQLLNALETTLAACNATEPRPVHGALHAAQWLENGGGLALLDYDSLALGDPELDAATFLADLDVQNRERVAVDRLAAAFISGYEAAADPLDPRLLATYRAQRRLEKALRVARTLRPDGDEKAARRLRRALDCLEGSV
jgi:phosphotransferase family enzyme